ncbi:MAG: hypothetical protein JWL67_117 [Solirubrobacterales bacterium]|nr:hypothetical protein [Solirubrobacterales bacterium]
MTKHDDAVHALRFRAGGERGRPGGAVGQTAQRAGRQPPGRARGTPERPVSLQRQTGRGAGMHTLVLTGELDGSSAHTLEAAIEHLCAAGTRGITLDLRRLSRIDATGVAVVTFRSRLCQRRGYDFELIQGPSFIRRAFERAGVLDSLPFRDAIPEEMAPAP